MSGIKKHIKRLWVALTMVAHLISVPLVTVELWLVSGGRPSIVVPMVVPADRAFQVATFNDPEKGAIGGEDSRVVKIPPQCRSN